MSACVSLPPDWEQKITTLVSMVPQEVHEERMAPLKATWEEKIKLLALARLQEERLQREFDAQLIAMSWKRYEKHL